MRKQNVNLGYIELTHETGWKKPIQARFYKKYHGKLECFHFFSEWNSFDEAIEFLKYKHSHIDIIIRQQSVINI